MTEDGDSLLLLFDPDPACAEQKIGILFRKLVKFFAWRGCGNDQDLAQDVFLRVMQGLKQGKKIYEGKLEAYFYRVAYLRFLENLREEKRKATVSLTEGPDFSDGPTLPEHWIHVSRCLERLTTDECRLLEEYYESRNRSSKQRLARRLGLSVSGLTVRVHRIKERLRDCLDLLPRPNLKAR